MYIDRKRRHYYLRPEKQLESQHLSEEKKELCRLDDDDDDIGISNKILD